jgi:superoxide dismutase, Cu-Zn family
MRLRPFLLSLSTLIFAANTYAELSINIYPTTDTTQAAAIGTVTITETAYGLIFAPHLSGLNAQMHGFHLHTNPNCGDKGMAAGGHYDPAKTNKHLGPYLSGHLGDLPPLYVNADGTSTLPLLAPRLQHLDQVKGHAIMIHEGGDNYRDEPQPLGGGGARMFCGVIPGNN